VNELKKTHLIKSLSQTLQVMTILGLQDQNGSYMKHIRAIIKLSQTLQVMTILGLQDQNDGYVKHIQTTSYGCYTMLLYYICILIKYIMCLRIVNMSLRQQLVQEAHDV
jgi:hypothetical protein